MKKLSLFLLSVSMSFISFGQTKIVNGDTINKTDSKNMKQGYWEESVNSVLVKGTYKGETVWIGVQEFGLPLSACTQPSVALKNQIDFAGFYG